MKVPLSHGVLVRCCGNGGRYNGRGAGDGERADGRLVRGSSCHVVVGLHWDLPGFLRSECMR